jgi:hypothetical protein
LQWLFEAKKRFSISILNYTVTSNHIHLIGKDDKGEEVIPESLGPGLTIILLTLFLITRGAKNI